MNAGTNEDDERIEEPEVTTAVDGEPPPGEGADAGGPAGELELFRDPSDDPDDGEPSGVAARADDRAPRLIVVSGAKGGAGKTVLAANVAVYLATIGRRVVLVDAEVEGANAHTCLGVERPLALHGQAALDPVALARGEGPPPAAAWPLLETPMPGLSLLHGGIDEPPRGETKRRTRVQLAAELRNLPADYVVVDLGSGTHPSLLDVWLSADQALFVTLPEPTAFDNTYRFIRAAFARHLEATAPDSATRDRVIERLRSMGNTPPPLDLARRLEAAGDPLADHVREAMGNFQLHVVFNQTRLRADLELGESMRSAVRRRFGLDIDYLGYVDYDDTVWNCVRLRRPLLVESPGTRAAKSIEKIARRLLAIESGKARRRPLRTVPAESHHDMLEVDRGATDEEIRRAFKRVREIYASDALVCHGLFDAPSMDTLRARLEEAYDVLLDPARRRPYELSVFPDDPEPEAAPSQLDREENRPPPPVITPDTEYTGALLRAVRESQGIDVRDICNRTKIGSAYLKAIEDDDFGSLPAPVYVRGFVAEVAKFLRLDVAQVSRTYVRRYRRYLEEREKSL